MKPFQLTTTVILLPYVSARTSCTSSRGFDHVLHAGRSEPWRGLHHEHRNVRAGSLGFSTQSPKSGFTTYVQTDLRVGSNIQGWGLIGGLRYSY